MAHWWLTSLWNVGVNTPRGAMDVLCYYGLKSVFEGSGHWSAQDLNTNEAGLASDNGTTIYILGKQNRQSTQHSWGISMSRSQNTLSLVVCTAWSSARDNKGTFICEVNKGVRLVSGERQPLNNLHGRCLFLSLGEGQRTRGTKKVRSLEITERRILPSRSWSLGKWL